MPWREDKHPRRFGWLYRPSLRLVCGDRCRLWVMPALLHGLQAAFDRDLALERFRLQGRTSLSRDSACKADPEKMRSGEGSTSGTVTRKDQGRSGTLDGYYWVREVQSGPPLGPSRSKGSEAGCRLSSDSSRGSKCPPPRFLRRGGAAGRRRSVLNGDSRRIGVAESSRSRRARWGSMDVSVGMFGKPSR
jgi:hypothetical protein